MSVNICESMVFDANKDFNVTYANRHAKHEGGEN